MNQSIKNSKIRILGVMTGTSCDGLDAVCLEVDSGGWSILWSESASYPLHLKKRVLNLQKPKTQTTLKDFCELNTDLGIWYSQVIKKIISAQPLSFRPHVIANHGQTVSHFPPNPTRQRLGSTLQLGDPFILAVQTGCTVVSNFRLGDMAGGGQGAPLVPAFHALLSEVGSACHNIGGISNLTYLKKDGSHLAFDTGPGNIWIDEATIRYTRGKRKFDSNGKFAQSGKIDVQAVMKVLKEPYFKAKAPKSTGRDDFPFSILTRATKTKGVDLIATATAVTVESIARAYESEVLARRLPLKEIFICGGGANNQTLLSWLQDRMPEVEIRKIDELGIDSQRVEGAAFAFLGYLSLRGQSLGGAWTGVKGWAPPGAIIPGKNWEEVTRLI